MFGDIWRFFLCTAKKRLPSQECRGRANEIFICVTSRFWWWTFDYWFVNAFYAWIGFYYVDGAADSLGDNGKGNRCSIVSSREFLEFDKFSTRFFIAFNWYAGLRSTCSPFNLCASLFARFYRGANENISEALERVQINAKTINTVAASVNSRWWFIFDAFSLHFPLIPRSALLCHSANKNRKWNSLSHVFNLASDCFLLELSRVCRQLFNLQKVAAPDTICRK